MDGSSIDRSRKILISAVVCAFNEEEHLSSCLDSLAAQKTRLSYEVIVIDDGSTDGTRTIAMDWARRNGGVAVRHFQIVHGGLSVARNTGVDRSRGEIVAFVDADARAEPTWLENIAGPFSDPAVDVVAGRVSNLDDRQRFSRFIHRVHFEAVTRAMKDSGLTGANMAFRKNIFESEGIGFFDYFDRRGDETSLRVRYFGRNPSRKLVSAPDAVVHNQHPDRFFTWLSQQSYEGAMTAVIESCIDEHIKRAEIIAKLLVRSGALAALPIALLAAQDLPLLAVLALAFWGARMAFRARYILESMRGGVESEGPLGAIAALGVVLTGTMARDLGYLRAVPLLLLGKKIDMGQSVGSVVASWDDESGEISGDEASAKRAPE
tara:strand:+ start:1671 stop:2804 length:1134 start_codon:yes stop_codon:yes gene_type:complete